MTAAGPSYDPDPSAGYNANLEPFGDNIKKVSAFLVVDSGCYHGTFSPLGDSLLKQTLIGHH